MPTQRARAEKMESLLSVTVSNVLGQPRRVKPAPTKPIQTDPMPIVHERRLREEAPG